MAVCRELGELFHGAGETLYLVGGAVRDLALGRGGHSDLDFTTSAAPGGIDRIVRPIARASYDKSRAKGYGTRGVVLKSGPEVEITPYRDAGGEAPTLERDLCSRDFTINAMAVDLDPTGFGAVRDPCGGGADLRARLLRTPRDPEQTFLDDPLRLLRAPRFAADMCLQLDPAARDTIRRMAALPDGPLAAVSPERVREELLHMAALPRVAGAFDLMRELGLLRAVLPELQALAHMRPEPDTHHKDAFRHTLRVARAVRGHAGADPVLVFAALLHDIGKPDTRDFTDGAYSFNGHEKTGARLAAEVCQRLRFSKADTARVERLVLMHHRVHPYTEEWTDRAVRRAVNELGPLLDDVLALSHADITTSDPDKKARGRRTLEQFVERVQALDRDAVINPRPPIDGVEIMRLLGLDKGGPRVGRAVRWLKDQIVNGELDPQDAETARRMIRRREWDNS